MSVPILDPAVAGIIAGPVTLTTMKGFEGERRSCWDWGAGVESDVYIS